MLADTRVFLRPRANMSATDGAWRRSRPARILLPLIFWCQDLAPYFTLKTRVTINLRDVRNLALEDLEASKSDLHGWKADVSLSGLHGPP